MSARQIIGLATAACVACCIGPIVGVLGAVAAAGILSTLWIGLFGVVIGVGATTAMAIVRRRRNRCVARGGETPVVLRPNPLASPPAGAAQVVLPLATFVASSSASPWRCLWYQRTSVPDGKSSTRPTSA